jgi:hypothetical protein
MNPDILYRLDDKGRYRGMIITPPEEAQSWNDRKFGIFTTPNKFYNNERKEAQLEELRYFYTDIDEGEKEAQLELIHKFPIKPTYVVETRRGFHIWWKIDGHNLPVPRWKAIQKKLITKFNGDIQCCDVSRTLRVPGYYHHKKEPFLVRLIANNGPSDIRMFLAMFPVEPVIERPWEKDCKMIKKDTVQKEFSGLSEGNRDNRMRDLIWRCKMNDMPFSEIREIALFANSLMRPPLGREDVEYKIERIKRSF